MAGWIGIDLDGTLAKYDGWKGVDHIGEPIPVMLDRVKRALEQGKEIKIFTARACRLWMNLEPDELKEVQETVIKPIEDWCLKHVGRVLPVTALKDFGMIELWDDRAVSIAINTGEIIAREDTALPK